MAKVVKMDGYATHQKALIKYALKAKSGDTICELGCGYYSTPILSEICQALGLIYKVYYSDKVWQQHIEKITECIQWNYVEDWTKFKLDEEVFLVLLDSEELVINRNKQIRKSLYANSEFIVVHDACTYQQRGINLQKEYNGELFNDLTPNTYVIHCKRENKLNPHERLAKALKPSEGFKINQGFVKLRNDKSKTAVVCCYTPGGDYDKHHLEYIKRLHDGVKANTTENIAFHCITTADLSSLIGVRQIQPLKKDWEGWHIKSEIFRDDIWAGYDRVLYLDLDTQIIDNIDDIINSEKRFMMLRDFYAHEVQETGMLFFNPSDFTELYEVYVGYAPNKSQKDADIISKYIKTRIIRPIKPMFFQDHHRIGSYKISVIRENIDYKKFQIVCYHGTPRPHEINWDLSVKINRAGPLNQATIKKITPNVKKPGALGNLLNGDMPYAPVETDPLKRLRVVKDVEPIWKGEDVFIIGGGPSLKNIDLDRLLEGKNVLGINDGYQFECCDICYFGDTIWHHSHKDKLMEWGKPIYSTAGVYNEKIHFLNIKGTGLSDKLNEVGWNSNSGFAGFNLALHLGAERIFLLGFDMNFDPKTNESNWHENIRNVNDNSYRVFLSHEQQIFNDYNRYFSDREVYACITPDYDTEMTIFPKVRLNELFDIDEGALVKDKVEV